MQTMGTFSGTCEIIELTEELDFSHDLEEANPLSCGLKMSNRDSTFSIGTMAYKCTLDDDINYLFEAIDRKSSARGARLSYKMNAKSPSTKRLSSSVSQASGIGISDSVTLKQALRGFCISHASEIAAMRRLSESVVGSSKVSRAGSIKKLYRAVVEADESGFPLNEGKRGLVEFSLVPEQCKLDPSKNISLQEQKEKSLIPDVNSSSSVVASSTAVSMTKFPVEKEIVPVSTETVKHTPFLKLRQRRVSNSALSLSIPNSHIKTTKLKESISASTETRNTNPVLKVGKNLKLNLLHSLFSSTDGIKVNKISHSSPVTVNPVRKSDCSLKKKKEEPHTICTSSNAVQVDDNNDMCSSTSQITQNVTKESIPALCSSCLNVEVSSSYADSKTNKPGFLLDGCRQRNMDTKESECSRSRGPEFSQSSKCSAGEFSNSTSVSEKSDSCATSCSGSRPHMAKDLRWDAIHHVEMEQGRVGLKSFKLLKQLGSGDVGIVYLAQLIGTSCLFAVKVMDTDSLGGRKKISRAHTERDILQMLDHPFLPTLFAHFTSNKYSILVTEYCPGGDLHVLRQKQPGGSFTEQAARFYAAEVLLAMEYLHMLGIVYRDLKPENILVREDGHIMLSDFDLSLTCTVKPTLVKTSSHSTAPTKKRSHPCTDFRCINNFCPKPLAQVPCFTSSILSTSHKARMLKSNLAFQIPEILAEPTDARSNSFVGTHEYLAPEIIKGEGHGNAVDWWTFGIFLYELLFGTTPFKGLVNDETLCNVIMHSIDFPASPSINSHAKDLIKGLLVKDPQERLGSIKGAAEIRQHPFFKGLNWALIRSTCPPVLPKSCDVRGLLLGSDDSNLEEYTKIMEGHTKFEIF